MNSKTKIAVLGTCTVLMLLMDLPCLRLVPEAEAIAGVRRRTARRTAVVVGSSVHAADSAQAAQAQQQQAQQQQAQQQTAASEQQAADAQAQAAAAEKDADAYKQEAAAAAPLAIGTVVTALPSDCTTLSSGGQQYYQCGKNYFRAAFQGSQLVYVTTEKP